MPHPPALFLTNGGSTVCNHCWFESSVALLRHSVYRCSEDRCSFTPFKRKHWSLQRRFSTRDHNSISLLPTLCLRRRLPPTLCLRSYNYDCLQQVCIWHATTRNCAELEQGWQFVATRVHFVKKPTR